MEYELNELKDIITDSCKNLIAEQPMLFSRECDINERTISGELSSIISNYIQNYHVNCEYNRMTDKYGDQIPKRIGLDPNHENQSRVFPDIIIHRQEDAEHNLLVVEIKMSWKNSEKDKDLMKLNLYTQSLGYKYGLYLELSPEGISEMIWFSDEFT